MAASAIARISISCAARRVAYLKDVEFDGLVDNALETTKRTLQRDFDIDAAQIVLKRPAQPELVKGNDVNVAAWQIVVPVNPTPNTPKSRIKIEFANVPSYDSKPLTVSRHALVWFRSKTVNPQRRDGE